MERQEVAAALAGGPFAAALERGAPLVIAAGSPAAVVFATPAALELMQAGSCQALEAALFSAQSPGARRLRRLAETLPIGGAPRRELLRFYSRGAPLSLTLISARLLGPEGEPWAAISTPAAAFEPEVAPHESAPAPAPSAEKFQPPPLDGPVRFLWMLDAEGRFGAIDSALVERLGPNAPRPGETLAELSARTRFGSGWIEAVATQSTFSGLHLAWPEPGPRARIVRISGSPAFDRQRAFAGFRGFGVFTGEAAEAPPPPPPPVPEVAKAPPPAPPEPEPPPPPRSRGEIVVLRPPPPPSGNVVPIRPGALGVLTSTFEDDDPAHAGDSVELSTRERDAFREIARALGVRGRINHEGEAPAETSPEAAKTAEPISHEDLLKLIDALPIGALVTRDGQALWANRALLEFAGFASAAELQAADGLKRMFRGRDPQTLIAGGEDLPIVGPDGEIAMAYAQADDIEWRDARATLISLRRSRELEHLQHARSLEADARAQAVRAKEFRRAVDVACDGYVRLDSAGRVLAMSPRAEKLFGYAENEAAGERFLFLLAPASQALAIAALQTVLRGDSEAEPMRLELFARDRGGRVFPAEIALARLEASEGAEAFFVIVDREAFDAAERERQAAFEFAKRANERKTEFLAAVSHEIRTPLHAILGFAEVMMEERFGPVGNERYRDYVKDIHASGQHVVSLANDLIDLAKVESGKLELEFAPVDINQVIRDCVQLMQPQASRERIIVRMSLADRLPNVMADQRSLRQIVLNLMSNAVKYNEPGGQVIISTALDDTGHTVIRVRDTGVGMSEAELSVAMEPFKRAGAKTTEGSGLGLPLTKALVEANRGDISIKSRKDQGTLVEVAFPDVQAAQ